MSSLKQLAVIYGEDEEEEEEDVSPTFSANIVKQGIKRSRENGSNEVGLSETNAAEKTSEMKLEIPTGILDMFKAPSEPGESTSEHEGRIRSFEHFPGNWATHVLVPFDLPESFSEFLTSLKKAWPGEASELHTCDVHDFHVSISRTVPIRNHWIEPLKNLLQQGFQGKRSSGYLHNYFTSITSRGQRELSCFNSTKHHVTPNDVWFVCDFPKVSTYVNDEHTRTFVALDVAIGALHLKDLVQVVDKAFLEFGLQEYYQEPSFHASFAWCLGDISENISPKTLVKLQNIFHSYLEENHSLVLTAKDIRCHIGNKVLRFHLS